MDGPRARPIVPDPARPSPSATETDALRAQQRRLREARAHGELFPLPAVAASPRPGAGAPAYAVQRWRYRTARHQRVNDAIVAVNQLAASTSNSSSALQPRFVSPRPTTASQHAAVEDFKRVVKAYGPQPKDLDESTALAELLAVKDLYAQEPRNLAEYQYEKLKVCRGQVRPKDAKSLLPLEAAGLLHHFASCIERSSEEIEHIKAAEDFPRPHWDPTLKRDRGKLDHLLRRMAALNLAGFRRKAKAKVGLFFVKKKDDNIRLIIDGRQANRCHRPPPKTRLGSVSATCELDLSDQGLLDCGGFGEVAEVNVQDSDLDVDDCFYQFLVEELGSWFAMDHRVRASEWGITEVWDDDLRRRDPVGPDEMLFPCFHAMSMGWTWALHLANESVAYLTQQAAGRENFLWRECCPAPQVRKGEAVAGVYVDNVTAIGAQAGDSSELIDKVAREAAACDIGVHSDAGRPGLDGAGQPGRRPAQR